MRGYQVEFIARRVASFFLKWCLVLLGPLMLATWESKDSCSRAQDADTMEKKIQAVLEAKSPIENLEAYAALFNNAGNDDISSLKRNVNIAISLRAAWEQVRRSIPETEGALSKVEGNRLHSFTGFLEAKLDCEIPDWWKQTLHNASSYSRGQLRFSLPPTAYEDTKKDGVSGRIDVSELNPGDPLIIETGPEKLEISASRVEAMLLSRGVVSFFLTKERIYLAWHWDVPGSYYLHCIDRKNGKIRWTSKIWAEGGHVFYSGISISGHVVAFVNTKNSLVLFGASGGCIYVEAFNKDNGKEMYRFSTGY